MTTILITGANRGIGLELARHYLKAGYQVIATMRNVAAFGDKLPLAEIVALDVSDSDSVSALSLAMKNRTIDILINNAGTIGPDSQSTAEMDFGGFIETLNINTLGPLRVIQALLPALRRSKSPKIITLTSKMGSLSYASSDRVAYRASKAAANKVTQCLATDLKPLGIAVAALHPGWVRTDMGGPEADISVEESATGIAKVIDQLTIANTGHFWNYDGSYLDW
jgi:NAD(P)-dependent dehydrogenase (short-subunit alcohol dehydrogenase family)